MSEFTGPIHGRVHVADRQYDYDATWHRNGKTLLWNATVHNRARERMTSFFLVGTIHAAAPQIADDEAFVRAAIANTLESRIPSS